MNPDQQPDPKLQNVYNPLSVMREGEKVLCQIKRHPIGILGVYFMAAVIVVFAIGAAAFVPTHVADMSSQNKAALLFGALIVVVIALLYTYVARVIYIGNSWILTDDSLTQVTQDGLFRKHSSQLSLANLEDVTADQNGMIQSMVGYGTLRAETAGERSKFVFLYCPKPTDYARRILAAREAFIANDPAAASRANDKLDVPHYSQAYQPAQPQAQSQDPATQQAYNPVPSQPESLQSPVPQPTQVPPYQQPQQTPSYGYQQPQAPQPMPPQGEQSDNYPPSADGQYPE